MAGIGSLPLFHRVAGKRVVVIGEGTMAAAKRRLVVRAGGVPCPETEAHHARLAFVAIDDERADEAAAARLRGKGLLVNVADRPDLCDFTMPSILDREPVLIAISTSGASAGLAKHLRLRLEGILPQSLGRLATALAGARETMRARWPGANERRTAVDEAMAPSGALDPLDEESPDRIHYWLDGASQDTKSRLVTIRIASDDADDLTLRQARLLGTADVIWHDADIPSTILTRARADAQRRILDRGAPVPEAPEDGPGLTLILTRNHPSDAGSSPSSAK